MFPNVIIADIVTVWQVKSCDKIFVAGCLRLTHGKITILLAHRGIPGPGRGSFKATRSQNGRHPDRVHFYGFMGNVSFRPELTLSQVTDSFYPF